jgi:hypothetical protein
MGGGIFGGVKDCLDETDERSNDVDDSNKVLRLCDIDAHSQVGLFPLHRLQEKLCCRVRMLQCPLAIGLLICSGHFLFGSWMAMVRRRDRMIGRNFGESDQRSDLQPVLVLVPILVVNFS